MVRPSQEIQAIQTNIVSLLNKERVSVTDVFKNTKTLRLTKHGSFLLTDEFDNWTFEAPKMTGKNLIALMQKMTYPYYLDKKVMILFTEKDAFMAKLAGVQGWLDGK